MTSASASNQRHGNRSLFRLVASCASVRACVRARACVNYLLAIALAALSASLSEHFTQKQQLWFIMREEPRFRCMSGNLWSHGGWGAVWKQGEVNGQEPTESEAALMLVVANLASSWGGKLWDFFACKDWMRKEDMRQAGQLMLIVSDAGIQMWKNILLWAPL